MTPSISPGTHEHGWQTESAHPTSEGCVVYVRCTSCGARRVDVRWHPEVPPAPSSRVVPIERSAQPSVGVGAPPVPRS